MGSLSLCGSIFILGSFVLRWILQSTVGGTSIYGPLATPIIRWLYELDGSVDQFNQTVIVQAPADVSAADVASAREMDSVVKLLAICELVPGPDGPAVSARVHPAMIPRSHPLASVRGAYAHHAVVPAHRLVPLPSGVDAAQGAAVMLQGMTAHYLATSTYPLRDGDWCLVHAAAGGVGRLLVQVARRRGTTNRSGALARAHRLRDVRACDVVLKPAPELCAATSVVTAPSPASGGPPRRVSPIPGPGSPT